MERGKKMDDLSIANNNGEKENRQCYRIDQFMIPAKIIYMFYGAKISCYEPYMFLFLTSIGLSPGNAGIINGIRMIGFVIGGVFWGFVADYKKFYRLVIVIVTFGVITAMTLQPILSLLVGKRTLNTCPILPEEPNNQSNWSKNHTLNNYTETSGNTSKLFYTMLVINIIAKFFEGPHNAFIDSGVIERCRMHPGKPDYGFQRIYGPVGFAMGIVISNTVVDNFAIKNVTCYSAIFIVFVVINIGFLINAIALYKGLTFSSAETSNVQKETVFQALAKSCDVSTIFFMLTVLVSGILQSFFISFTFVLLKDMNAPSMINATSIAVGAIACIVSFYRGSCMIKKFGGTWLTILLCISTYSLRFGMMAYVQNPWLIPPIQILQTFNFALFLVAAVTFIKETTQPEIQTSMYSIMNSLYYGLGVLVANLSGGEILKRRDARTLFKIASAVALIWSMVIIIYILVTKFLKPRHFKKDNKELKMKNMRDLDNEESLDDAKLL